MTGPYDEASLATGPYLRYVTSNEGTPQNPAEMSGINDQDVRNLVLNLATFINDLVQIPPYEPNVDMAEIDASYSSTLYQAPLTYTHQLMRYLLEGVRDSLLGISNTFSCNSISYIPAAALVRQIAEYSAAVSYISDPADSAQMRISKMLDMTLSSLVQNENSGHHHPKVRQFYARSRDRIAGWKGGTDLPRVKKRFVNKSHAVAELFKDLPDEYLGKGYYDRLSGLAHPSVVDLTHAMELMWRENPAMQATHYGEACADILVGARCAFFAVVRSTQFHVPRTELERDLVQVRIEQLRWFITELLARLSAFRKTASERADEAFRFAGMERPDDFFE